MATRRRGLLGPLIDRVREQGNRLKVNLPTRRQAVERVVFGPQPVQKALAGVGRQIQKFTLPPAIVNLPGEKFIRQGVQEAVRSPGRTLERVFTPQGRTELAQSARRVTTRRPSLATFGEPAVEAAFDVSDITPLGLFAGTAADVAKPLARFAKTSRTPRAAAKLSKEFTPRAGDVGENVLRTLGKQFEQGRKLRKESQKGPGFLRSFRKNFLDRFSEIERVDRTFFRDLRLLSGGGSGRAEQIISDGTLPILQRESGRLDDFSKFLSLQRINELVNVRGITRQFDSKEISEGLGALERKLGPDGIKEMSQSAVQLRGFLDNALNLYQDSGMISKQSADAAKSSNQQYITFEAIGQMLREAGDEGPGFAKQSFNVARQSVINAIGTSKSGIADPLESTFQKLFHQIELADRNSVLRDFVTRRTDLVTKIDEGARVPVGKGIINLFEDGKKVTYQVDKEVADTIKNVDAQSLPNFLRFLTIPTRIIKKGAVEFNPAFTLGVNPIRDLQDALISTGVERGGRESAQLLSSYGDNLAKTFNLSEEYGAWRRAGGSLGGIIGAEVRQAPETAIRRTQQRGQKFLETVKTPGGLLKAFKRVSESLENTPRLARFRQEAGEAIGKEGFAPFAQLTEETREAAFASRTGTLDFARAGNISRFVNQIIPFFNVGVQGTARLTSLAKDNPEKFLRTIGTGVGIPATTIYLNNRRFDDFSDVQDFERGNNMIIMLRDRTEEEKQEGKPIQAIKVPLGNIIKPFYNTIESFLDFANEGSIDKLDDLGLNLLEDLSPIGIPIGGERFRKFAGEITPQFARPIVEQAANINLFTGAPIVPQRLEGVEPEEQFTEKTGAIPKLLGRLTGTSPARIQELASSVGGTVGRAALAPAQGIPSATVGRFFGPRKGAEKGRQFEDIEKIEREAETARLKQTREAESIFKDIKGNPEEARTRLLELARTDPELAERVIDIAEDAAEGLTSIERRLKGLGVQNGARSKAISSQLNKLKTNKEKQDLLLDLSKKRILTEDVLDQVLDELEAEADNRTQAPQEDGLVSQVREAAGEAVGEVGEALAGANIFNPPEAQAGGLLGERTTTFKPGEEPKVETKRPGLFDTLSRAFGRAKEAVGGLFDRGEEDPANFGPTEEQLSQSSTEAGFEKGPDGILRRVGVSTGKAIVSRSEKSLRKREQGDPLIGFNIEQRAAPPNKIKDQISKAARKHGISSSLLAAVLWQESGFEPNARNQNVRNGKVVSTDRGIAQLNDAAFPKVSDKQALNTEFATDFAAKILAANMKSFDGDIQKAVLAYNLGVRGVSLGRPDVNDYINGVRQNLTPDVAGLLGFVEPEE